MGEIHALPGHGPVADQIGLKPHPDIVARLEELLALARAGRIRAIAYATVDPRNCTFNGWVSAPEEPSGHSLIAGVAYLQHEIVAEKCSMPTLPPPICPEPA
mgnify:CR=1 FL=1